MTFHFKISISNSQHNPLNLNEEFSLSLLNSLFKSCFIFRNSIFYYLGLAEYKYSHSNPFKLIKYISMIPRKNFNRLHLFIGLRYEMRYASFQQNKLESWLAGRGKGWSVKSSNSNIKPFNF